MAGPTTRISIALGEVHCEKLKREAERLQLSPARLAASLLSTALDEADLSAADVTALLDGIDGAFDDAEAGMEDFSAGRFISLEDL